MYYDINISKNGKHYFAIAERSALHKDKARILFNDFIIRYPKNEGFEVTITLCETKGYDKTEKFQTDYLEQKDKKND